MVTAPVALAVIAALLAAHLARSGGELLAHAVLAGRLHASAAQLRLRIDRLSAGGPGAVEPIRDAVASLEELLGEVASAEDVLARGRGRAGHSIGYAGGRVREGWLAVSSALRDLGDPARTAADSIAACATLRDVGPRFCRSADELAVGIEAHLRREQAEHRGQLTTLLTLLVTSLLAGAVVKSNDLRRLKRQTSDLERLSLVAECTGSSVALADRDGVAIWANDAFTRTTGWETVSGRPIRELVGADLDSLAHAAIGAAIRRREPHVGEYELVRRDGRPFWAAIEVTPVPGTIGNAGELMLIFTDITARVRAARELFASETRFRSAVAAISEGFLLFEADARVVQCNAAALRILGLTEPQLLGSPLRDHIGRYVREDGSPCALAEFPVVVTQRTARPLRGVVLGVDRAPGQRAWVSIDSTPFVLSGDGAQGVVATFTDITARRDAERSLRVLTRVVEESPIMVLVTDGNDRIEYVNRAFEAATGYPLAELRGRDPAMMLSDQTPRETWEEFRSALESGGAWRGEIHGVTRAGAVWLADAQVFALRGELGAVAHHVALVRDITELRQRERELTAAREAAVAGARAKREFLQNVSHELCTPLNGIMGMSELLLRSPLDAAQRTDVLQLRRSADELVEVITQLLDFARVESGEGEPASTPFRLRAALSEVGTWLAGQVEPRGLASDVEVAADVPDAIVGDPGTLRRVLGNLASNAVKFTEQGGVGLHVSLAESAGERVTLRFEMRDTGIGIPLERQAEIFEAFSQVDGSPTRRHGGVGLGLALASRLVRRMGGQLAVRSEPGTGSAFEFFLSFGRAAPEDLPALDGAAAPPLVDARVLVLAGRPPGPAPLRAALERAGAEVRMASRVRDACDEVVRAGAEGRPYRAIVIDARDGRLDGFAAFEELGALGEGLPPALLFTSVGQRGDAERCRSLGIAGYLAAPACEPDLVDALGYLRHEAAGLVTRHLLREVRARRRVLLVDDNAVNRKVASRMLERLGYDVSVACDGREGFQRYAGGGWDLVLMDVQMPEMDGLEAARRIRAHEREHAWRRTPVLALTAHTVDENRAAVIAAGMDELLPKPVRLDDLAAALRRFLAGPPVESPADDEAWSISDVVDWDEAMTRLDGDEDLFRQLLEIFEADAGGMIQGLDESCSARDPIRLQRAAHSLKGACGTISARAVTPLAAEVEALARDGRIDEAGARAGELGRELRRLVRVLRTSRRREAA